jgi:hypothetical protein
MLSGCFVAVARIILTEAIVRRQVRANDWDPICEKHYGQRPCVPHKQAGHMTAAANAAATSKKCLPIGRRPHMTLSGLAACAGRDAASACGGHG